MAELQKFCSIYELINLEAALRGIEAEYGVSCSFGSCSRDLYINDHSRITVAGDVGIRYDGEDVMTIRISEPQMQDLAVHGKKYRVNCVFDEEMVPGDLCRFFFNRLKRAVPPAFISMEHYLEFLESCMEISFSTIPENLLGAAMESIDRVFDDYTRIGDVTFMDSEKRGYEKVRVEISDTCYVYIDINLFRIYRKDETFITAGLSRRSHLLEKPSYNLSLFVERQSADMIMKLLNERFEEQMIIAANVKGKKFTGDGKEITLLENITLDDIVLEEPIRKRIVQEIFDFFRFEEYYRRAGIPFKRGVILHGPAGTGKTMLAKAIVSVMEQTVIWVKAGDIETPADIDRVFRLARIGAPAVIILEDADFYLQNREGWSSPRTALASIMSHLDGLEENNGILTVMTTNRINQIEPAVSERPGRIDSQIFMGEIGRVKIAMLLEMKLSRFTREFGTLLPLIPELMVMTGAQGVELATNIIRKAIMDTGSGGEIIITEKHVHKAIKDHERWENQRGKAGFGRIL